MSTATKRPQLKPVRVAPTVTDPSMRNSRGPAEMLLNSETGDNIEQDQDRDVVFGGSAKTKEEQETVPDAAAPTSTVLIIVFALIVIALVALIVWMLMKQSNDKKDEDEVRRMIQPTAHPRNNMPPNYGPRQGGPQQHMDTAAYEAHQRNMAAMHQQQEDMQQHMAQLNAKLDDKLNTNQSQDSKNAKDVDESVEKQQKKKKTKSFAETMAEKDGKVVAPLKVPLADEEEPPKKAKFSKKNPHPGIMRPGGDRSQSDVDDILAQTQAAISKKASNKAASSKPAASKTTLELTDLDKALLDKVTSNLDNDEANSTDE